MVTLHQFMDGIKGYAQTQVIPHLPTDRQFVAGVALGVAANRADKVAQKLKDNPLVSMLGLIEDDMIDDDALFVALREQMNRQGSVQLDVPWLGKMTFSAPDVDAMQRAIHGR
jgi:hypothetical protein